MLRTKIAKRVLSKRDQNHLNDIAVHSTDVFETNREFHLKCVAEGLADPCPHCRSIAIKLGMEK